MTVSIEELCQCLGVKDLKAEEIGNNNERFMGNPILFDSLSLPGSRVIAPIVSNRLSKMNRVLELGCGYGFRLLYYALNNPHVNFLGIDNDSFRLDHLDKRISKLGLKNIAIRNKDMLDLKYTAGYGAVLAIDAIPDLPKNLRMQFDPAQYKLNCLSKISSLLDVNCPGHFLAIAHYSYPPVDDKRTFEPLTDYTHLPKFDFPMIRFTKANGDIVAGNLVLFHN